MNKLQWEEKDIVFSKCLDCKYYLTDGNCKAFPKGIPDNILDNSLIHSAKIDGQAGEFVFEFLTEKANAT